jgi:methyltransferase
MTIMAAQRMTELAWSARHVKGIRARGGREYGAVHFPLIVAVHTLFFLAFSAEIARFGSRPGPAWPLWLCVWLFAQGLRYASMRALGERWHVRVWVIPGVPLVKSGVYRWLRHPNYTAVVLELIAAPVLFGAWRTAAGIGVLNAVALAVRIRCENSALQRAAVDSSR